MAKASRKDTVGFSDNPSPALRLACKTIRPAPRSSVSDLTLNVCYNVGGAELCCNRKYHAAYNVYNEGCGLRESPL